MKNSQKYNIPEKLKEELCKQKVVILAGAGVSFYAKFPSWKELTIEICKKISEEEYPEYELLIPAIDRGVLDVLIALETIKKYNPIARELLKEKFNNIPPNFDYYIHREIANISRKIITTNYDKLFESATDINNVILPNSKYELARLSELEEYIFKVHGTIDNVDECILFKDDYERVYNDQNVTYTELKNLVMNNTILCIGFSMNDPFMRDIFKSINELYKKYKHKHYIITTDQFDYSEYNFQSIMLENYDDLSQLLNELRMYSMSKKIKSNSNQKNSDVYITKRFLRRRCRYSPVGSPDFIKLLTELTSYNIGIKTEVAYIKRILLLKSEFEKKIAYAALYEKKGNITEMINILEHFKFQNEEESVRLLFLGIAYEKLDRIDDAIDSYQKILAIENDFKLIKSAQFNLQICFEKKQIIDGVGFARFIDSDITLLGGQRIKDKALTMLIILCIKEKTPFLYERYLKDSLDYEINVNPTGYVKTMLSYKELKDERITESEIESVMNKLSEDIGVDARVAILKKLSNNLKGSHSDFRSIIDEELSYYLSQQDYSIKKHFESSL